MTRFSVLDQSATSAGKSHQETLQGTIALAKHCECLGYHRFWVAEHHNSPANVGSAPEILCAAIASVTGRIRVGSAGILLSHYAPLKVAEVFRVLSAIAPGRIDLGIGRSPGGSPAAVAALNRGAPDVEHEDNVAELLAWLEHDGARPRQDGVLAYPRDVDGPEPWMLGSSLRGARLAARHGLPFCFNFSHGTNYALAGDALKTYRSEFRPSHRLAVPLASLSIWTLAAETAEEVERLFAPRAYWRVMLDRGVRGPMISPEQAQREHYTAAEQARIDEMRRYSVVGAVSHVADRLRAIAADHAVDEIVLATWTFDACDQRKSYEGLAHALGLQQSGSDGGEG
ncbi:LLM class flavin-dependent oxidoreductase [Hyphomicrobium sp.]|uniref:LLM class flavin-dependent oxidoreductase n=1 Tax=Hyphomicrobium sp. TaxID=82 RepID=UPI0025C591B9|nr:LLM class flavin-dependent oxidoreductase [Hyphomicrobium sp.]MCC7250627.1 LLM class flavin-dependent oxidoreductase [Hyphomicrobium sp.]